MNARRQWKKRQRRRSCFRIRKIIVIGFIILTGGCISIVALNFDSSNKEKFNAQKETKLKTEQNINEVKAKPVKKEKFIAKSVNKEKLIAKHTITHLSSSNRDQNLARAAEIINGDTKGFILKPGEKFSYIKVIGNPTIKKGFKEAGEIRNHKPTTGIGGGVCQVMSTINSAIQKTNQKTDKKHLHAESHSIPSTYIKLERGDKEASVAYSSGKDFWFINTAKYSIRILVKAKKGNVTVKIFAIQ